MTDMQTRRRIDLPMQTRQAAVQSVQEDARTIELVWTTGARVMRMDYVSGERYAEDLSLDEGHVDLSRLNAGAPLLNTHGQYDLSDVIGVVDRAWVEGDDKKEGRAIVRFSERAEVDAIWRDVKAGIIRNVSVGYAIRRIEVDRESEEFPVYRAIDWEPMEVSLVPVPADAGAGTRDGNQVVNTCIITDRAQPTTQEVTVMDERIQDAGNEPVDNEAVESAEQVEVTTEHEAEVRSATTLDRDAVVAEERKRVSEINAIAARHSLPAEFVTQAIDDGTPITDFRAAALDSLAARSEATVINSRHNEQTLDNPAVRRSALEEALSASIMHRQPEGAGQHYAGLSFVSLARELTGENRIPVSQVVERAMAETSDFPLILANVGNKILLETYRMAEPTYRQFARRRDFNDFKAHSMVGLGDFPSLSEKTETGDYAEGTIGEKGETITPTEYGRIFHISRKALINDDLAAFSDMAQRAAMRALHTENDLVYGVLASNPVMADTNALFSVAHGNLNDATGNPSTAIAAIAKAAMRQQTSVDGMKLNIAPRFLVVGPQNEEAAFQLVSPIVPAQAANVNMFVGSMVLIVDANLDDEWYIFADPALSPVLAYGYVNGGAAPTFATDRRFESDSLRFRMQLDFGAGVVDYRGAYKVPGEGSGSA